MKTPFPLKPLTAEDERRRRRGVANVPQISAIALRPYIRAVRHVIKMDRRFPNSKHRHDTLATMDMLREFSDFLSSLPTPPRQKSIRWLPPKERAMAILKHIELQQGRYKQRPANEGAVIRILCRCIAIAIFPKATSNPQYCRTQTAHFVAGLMRGDQVILFGKKVRFLFRVRSKHVANHLYELTRPFFWWWLTEERKKMIKGQRWLKASSPDLSERPVSC